MRKLMSVITYQYKAILRLVSQKSKQFLFRNTPPCKYAHVVLGSVAKGECTTYSNVEHLILLDSTLAAGKENEITERFRWYALLFQVIIICIGESPIRLLGIPLLNDF